VHTPIFDADSHRPDTRVAGRFAHRAVPEPMASLPALRQSHRQQEIGRQVLKGPRAQGPKGPRAGSPLAPWTPGRAPGSSLRWRSTPSWFATFALGHFASITAELHGLAWRDDTPLTYSQGDNCGCNTRVRVNLANLVVNRPPN
jgi:hypothetical protein